MTAATQISIPHYKGSRQVLPKNIVRIEGSSNYSKIFIDNNEHLLVAKVLRWFEETLPKEMFIRPHRSHLVNKRFIKKIKGNITKTLVLHNGENIVISRRKKGGLMQQLLENL
jgi:two-component system, LytTR family, response regulator